MTSTRRPSPSPSSVPTSNSGKLPKFFQKQGRDQARTIPSPTSDPSTTSNASRQYRKSSKLLVFGRDAQTNSSTTSTSASSPNISPNISDNDKPFDVASTPHDNAMDEPPIIVEPASPAPIPIPRVRTRSERPVSERPVSDSPLTLSIHTSSSYSSSSTKIGDIPNRLSGWFQHTFSSSATDLTLPALLSQTQIAVASISSPAKAKSNPLLTAARHGKGQLDKAFRYLLDTDASPYKSPEPIWLLGVQHSGYEPTSPITPTTSTISRRGSADSRRAPSYRSSSSLSSSPPTEPPSSFPAHYFSSPTSTSLVTSPSHSSKVFSSASWPPAFYADFTSRVWVTYRSHFTPIRDSSLDTLEASATDPDQCRDAAVNFQTKRWPWNSGEKCWTSDAGWGCMLRTGQSLLANALMQLHLGRAWNPPSQLVYSPDYATYIQILTWFFDTPSPAAPFSVHRMALAGKELGTDVGQWFGPSVAAGALKRLTQAFPGAGIGVSVASDSVIFQSDVYAASNYDGELLSYRKPHVLSWGGRSVLVLIGMRLGIDGVNPIYHDTIKALYTFPQSVGIAGGRPSSSYYFVGSQAENLFYLDPHHTRPTIPLRMPPSSSLNQWKRTTTPSEDLSDYESEGSRRKPSNHVRSPTSPPSSVKTTSSTLSNHVPASPSPLQHQLSTSSSNSESSHSHASSQEPQAIRGTTDARQASSSSHARLQTFASGAGSYSETMGSRELSAIEAQLDELQMHLVSAYSVAELKTFHCERVRKMPLSALDPSMLIGFLCKDEQDWVDFRARVSELSANHKTIFTIQDEPPVFGSDDDFGLESMSEPDDVELQMHKEPEDQEVDHPEPDNDNFDEDPRGEEYYGPPSPKQGSKSSVDPDTEEDSDPMRPFTPGGGSSRTSYDLETSERPTVQKVERESRQDEPLNEYEEHGDDDEWVDPSLPSPLQEVPPSVDPVLSQGTASFSSGGSGVGGAGAERKKAKRGKRASVAVVTAPTTQFPFPRSSDEFSQSPPHSPEFSNRPDRPKRMHMARARDGGRTQSGGVKGVWD